MRLNAREKLAYQDRAPSIRQSIDYVGVEGIRVPLILSHEKVDYPAVATVNIMIDLDGDKMGVHMSRLTRAVSEALSRGKSGKPLEGYGKNILSAVRRTHPFREGFVEIHTVLVMRKKTPSSELLSDEAYDVCVKVARKGKHFEKTLQVKVVGSTLCPHSLERSNGVAHNQRADLTLKITTDVGEKILLEDMIDVCEEALSSPTYTILKAEDEVSLVKKMYSTPRFVEDVVRHCFDRISCWGVEGHAAVRAVSYESIHKHNAVAEIARSLHRKNSQKGLGV